MVKRNTECSDNQKKFVLLTGFLKIYTVTDIL